MSAISWITELVETVAKIFPRIAQIKCTHRAVIFKRGGAKEKSPGMIVYWPVWSELTVYPIKRQTLNIPPQSLTTKDRYTITVRPVVVYEISDILKAQVETYELDETATDVAQGVVKNVITTKTLDDILGNQELVDKILTTRVRSELRTYGARVIKVLLAEVCFSQAFRLFVDNSNMPQSSI